MVTRELKTDPHTRLTLGPEDAGRSVSSHEFAQAAYVEPWRYERVDGRLVVMSPDGGEHVRSTSPWLEQLILYKIEHPDLVEQVVPNAWVCVSDGVDRIGDIGVYLANKNLSTEIPDRVPELMFEVVSPGRESRERDYVIKRAEHHHLGVQEYVIIDRFDRKATVFSAREAGEDESTLSEVDAYETPLLPGLRILLTRVFGA